MYMMIVFVGHIVCHSMQIIMTHATSDSVPPYIVMLTISQVSLLLHVAPWLADVKIERYEVIKFAAVPCFATNIILFVLCMLITEGIAISIPTLVMSALPGIIFVTYTCASAAMLPFLTDQLIGATADQLSTVVYWYYWANNLLIGFTLPESINVFSCVPDNVIINNTVYLPCIVSVPLALIIISDCLCLQWLNRTHKVTNPIKLIIQVLNYTLH